MKPQSANLERKPSWIKVRAPGGPTYVHLKRTLRELDLHTVCEEARCPNVGECWNSGTATVMLLGHTCTRGCRFCAVRSGHPRGAFDSREPEHVASAVSKLGLRYVVLTMVNRDDLPDGGASHVAATVEAIRREQPGIVVEVLVGDFAGKTVDVRTVTTAAPDVFAHNIEVVRRLTPVVRDARCSYDRSLEVLRAAKRGAPGRLVKSSVMVGIGESDEEVYESLGDLRSAGVDIVTIGQYLRPSRRHVPVDRFVRPEQFAEFERVGNQLGFLFVASGPLVRSSYHAAEGFIQSQRELHPSHAVAGAVSAAQS